MVNKSECTRSTCSANYTGSKFGRFVAHQARVLCRFGTTNTSWAARKARAKGDSAGLRSKVEMSKFWGFANMQHHRFCKPLRHDCWTWREGVEPPISSYRSYIVHWETWEKNRKKTMKPPIDAGELSWETRRCLPAMHGWWRPRSLSHWDAASKPNSSFRHLWSQGWCTFRSQCRCWVRSFCPIDQNHPNLGNPWK